MANEINVPAVTPNPIQFQPPTDLVNGYLNRKQQNTQDTLNRVTDLGQTLNAYKQQRIQNQLAALQAYTGIAKAVGPDAANQVAGGIPNMPSFQGQTQNATPGQTPPSPSSQGSPQTLDGGQSPFIHASLQVGHPDVTGYMNRIGQLNGQMGQFQNKGDWGREQQQGIGQQIQGVKAESDMSMMPMAIAEKEANIRAANSKFATPTQGAAIVSGDPASIAGSYGGQAPVEAYNNAAAKQMEKNKTVAAEVSKQGPLTTEVKTLQGMFDNVDANLQKYYSQSHLPGSSNAYQITKGRLGSKEGATVLNQSAPLVAAINKSLTSRFNMGENELLSSTIAPSPNDTPDYAASKMRMLHQLIQAMDSGNKDNVSNVIATLNGNVPKGVTNGR